MEKASFMPLFFLLIAKITNYKMSKKFGGVLFLLLLGKSFLAVGQKSFKVIAVSDPSVTTQQLSSGNFTIGVTDNGGGMINQIILPGIGDIMSTETDRYGRGGQSAIRSMATSGCYNPTQAGFNETLGTQCPITVQTDKLIIQPRGVALWWSDAKYDFTQWENVGSDSFNSDGGNTDQDGINESTLPNKQADEVGSEFDYYGTYENYMNKNGITTPAIRHYYEYRFIRNPGNCLAQFSSSAPIWNPVQVQSDLSYQYPDGVYGGTDQDFNFMIAEYALRNDVSLWDPAYRYIQDFYGNWQVTTRDSDLTGYQNKMRQVFIIAESNDKNTGRAIGMYYPLTDINSYPVIGVNESDSSIAYKDNRINNSFIKENRYRISTMSSYGFNSYVLGLINRNRLPSGVYEAYRRELYIFYGTPQEIMTAIAALDTSLGIQTQASNVYFKQDFNTSVFTTNYVGSTTNLFDALKATGTTGAMGTASVAANKLNLAKTNAGNSYFARSTNLGLPANGVFQFSMDFDCSAVSGSSTNGTPYLAFGRNIDPTTANILPDSNAYVKVRFLTDNVTSGNFTVGNIVNSVMVNNSTTFSGTQKITIVLNNTVSTANYLVPDGVTTATISPNKMDLYVGNTLVFNEVNVNNTSQAISGFKFSVTGNNTNLNLDNLVFSDATNYSILPVNLTSFTGKAVGQSVQLNWTTLSEQNSDVFNIFSSSNGKNFSKIGSVNASGNSNAEIDYTFKDDSPYAGENYYKLQQVDKDGKIHDLDFTRVVSNIKPSSISAYTQPNGFSLAVYADKATKTSVYVYNISGQQIAKQDVGLDKGHNQFEIPAKLQAGVYIVKMMLNDQMLVQKVVNKE
ncbi:T9SS type A sorting domain-containing protein [Pelobium sp.]|nr:T9SS type A sorting domain-containing protein [Pelobium sp.]MDA9554787.1 T9SS type A sorting domain-containing protein [Pelobium sp.]